VAESLEADKKDKIKDKLKECKKKLMRVTPGVNKDFLNQSKISPFLSPIPDSSLVEILDDNEVSESHRTEKRKFENDADVQRNRLSKDTKKCENSTNLAHNFTLAPE
jgi:hypothetical protein